MEIGKYRILLPGLSNKEAISMQNSREKGLLKEFYSRHRPIIDALAEDDEMFRAVKEIAGTEGALPEKEDRIKSLDRKLPDIQVWGGICLS